MLLNSKFISIFLILNLSLLSCSSKIYILNYNSIKAEQKELLSKITGNSEIANGIKLLDRRSIENRKFAREYLYNMLSNISSDVKRHKYSDTGENVYTVIKASISTDEYMVLGAHFDSVKESPGANDNASGTALVYTAGKIISSLKNRNKNVIIVFFDEEEKRLIGSKHFAKMLKEENYNIHSVITVDQVGWDSDGDRAIELEVPYDGIKALFNQVVTENGWTIPIHETKVTSTDHRSFRSEGFKAVGVTEEYRNKDTTPFYHKPTDTFDTINLDYLFDITMLVAKVFERQLK